MMTDFRFTHIADVYYATEVQDEENFGIKKVWQLGLKDRPCELHSDKFNSDTRYSLIVNKPNFDYPLLLFGRFKEDIRQGNTLDSIVVSNIRSACGGAEIFTEPDGSNVLFELRSFQPYTNPWGQIEYYRTQVFRMQDQNEDIIEGGWQ